MFAFERSRQQASAALLIFATLASRARAEPPADARAGSDADARGRARELYQRALDLFEAASYEQAAHAFLDADALQPSSDALSNAIAAARHASDHLLVAVAAQRAAARESSDPKLAAAARVALAEAEVHLARLDLGCRPAPCRLSIDGESAEAGLHYLLPGTRTVRASFDASSNQARQLSLEAGALYSVTLEPTPLAAPAPTGVAAPSVAPRAEAVPKPLRARRPLPPWVFYAGAGASAVALGVTIWSGVDALDRVSHYKGTRTAAERERALSAVHRTDFLVAATVLLTGATTYAGLALVSFGDADHAVAVTALPEGALLTWSERL